MKVSFSDVVAIVAAGIALLALFVSLYASFVAQKVATSDFQAVELVKSETAQLISVLRTLVMKGVVYSQQDKEKRDMPDFDSYVDTKAERESIETFMHSSTALAYYTFVAKKSQEAREAKVKGEEWRTFFLQLSELRYTVHPWLAAKSAAKLERLFDGIDEKDISEIANNLDDLPRAIELLFSEREHDVVMHVMIKPDDSPINENNFIDFVRFLREIKSIDDPELDVFWSVTSGDIELLKKAQKKGANLTITSGTLINRYKEYISEFSQYTETQ